MANLFYPDYKKAVQTAIAVIEEYEINIVPVDLDILLDQLSRTVACISYSSFMKMHGFTFSQVVAHTDSDDAACFYRPKEEQYIILYNDIDVLESRKRFTIAHELGHIFLNHLAEAGTTVMQRSIMPQEEYTAYEHEADVFARNLLSPAPLAKKVLQVSPDSRKNSNIEIAFFISHKASNTRINLLNSDMRSYQPDMLKFISRINMQFRKICRNCKSEVPFEINHCELCGSSDFYYGNEYSLLPSAIPMTKKGGRMRICPKCGNTEISQNAMYCKICGLPLRNLCTGRRHINQSYARYCRECGALTAFGKLALDFTNERRTKMKYSDGVHYDHKTNRVKICPKCFNEEFSEQARFCRICGTELFNYCIGDSENEEYADYPAASNQHINPSNARYCEICGKPTIYFKKGILPNYEDYQKNTAENDVELGLYKTVDEALAGMNRDTTDDTEQAEKDASSEDDDLDIPYLFLPFDNPPRNNNASSDDEALPFN